MGENFSGKTFSTERQTFLSLNPMDVKSSNEKTPKSKLTVSQMSAGISNESNFSGSEHSSLKTTNLQLSMTSPSFIKTQFSTPKNSKPLVNDGTINNTNNESEFSITNPFESHVTIDSLLQPSLSPSMFASTTNQTYNESVSQSPGSFWNIDQIALMKPVDIDISKFHEQQNVVNFDPAVEVQAQKAIDNFFANGINITSPWSSSEPPHYLAIISPAIPSSTRGKRMHKRCDVNTTSSQVKNTSPLLEKESKSTAEMTATVSTQTALSIPCDVDLTKILKQYFTQNNCTDSKDPEDFQTNEVLSNSSLRRKLFFQDNVDDCEDSQPDAISSIDRKPLKSVENSGDDFDVFPMSSDSDYEKRQGCTKENMQTPLLKSKCHIPSTPSSNQSPFSSSPVVGGRMFDLGTPYRSHSLERGSPGVLYSPIEGCKRLLSSANENSSTETFRNRRLLHKASTFKNLKLNAVLTAQSSCDSKNESDSHLASELTEGDSVFAVEFEHVSPPLSPIQDTSATTS